MAADPEVSEGARMERVAVRNRLRRMIKKYREAGDIYHAGTLGIELQWILDRQMRYEQKAGGLGHK
jgi:hypothetical protein